MCGLPSIYLSAAGQGVPSFTHVYAEGLRFNGVFLVFGFWCCMRLDLLLGCLCQGYPGSTCISPVWLDKCKFLPLSLAKAAPLASDGCQSFRTIALCQEREREREKYYTHPALRLIQVLPGHPLAEPKR